MCFRLIGKPLLIAPLRAPAASLIPIGRIYLRPHHKIVPKLSTIRAFDHALQINEKRFNTPGGPSHRSLLDTSGSMACSKYRAKQTKRSKVNITRGPNESTCKKVNRVIPSSAKAIQKRISRKDTPKRNRITRRHPEENKNIPPRQKPQTAWLPPLVVITCSYPHATPRNAS